MNNRAVIIEDEYFVSNHLKSILQKNGFTVVATYHDGESALKDLPSLINSVFLLDIQLSGSLDGVHVALELQKRNIPFVFITANIEDTTFKSAIKTNPLAYISKPFKEMDVIAGVTIASQKLKTKIPIESGQELLMVNPEDVLYFKSDNNYVEVILENKKSYLLRKRLKALEADLPKDFKRCHKSFLINSSKITRLKGSFIYLNEIEIPLSRTYRDNFRNTLD
jgi:DNA-binding LytR/AlgR family response regulator